MSKQAWWKLVSKLVASDHGHHHDDDENVVGTRREDTLSGYSGDDRLRGLDGDDWLDGGAGNDRLHGGKGDDILIGGAGQDRLRGGRGTDLFVYEAASDSTPSAMDTIVGFHRGEDRIDLRALLGATDLAWGSTTPTANGVWYAKDAAHEVTYVHADINGSPDTSDLVIRLRGLHDLTVDDFLGVTAGPANSAPEAEADKALALTEDAAATPLNIAAPTDADGDALGISVTAIPDPALGTIYLADGVTSVGVGTLLTVEELQGLVFAPAGNASGAASFSYTVTDPFGATDSQTVSFDLAPAADAPSLSVASASGIEDTAIALSIDAALADGSEILSIRISGVPAGATLSAGTHNGDGSYTLSAENLAGLTLTPPANSDGGFELAVTATSTESDGTTASTVAMLPVSVAPAADAPMLSVEAASGAEDTAIALSITAARVDSSETLSIRISGVPSGATLSAGINQGDGSYTLTAEDLSGLTITPPANSDGNFDLTVTATSTESDGTTASTVATLPVSVAPVADIPTVAVTATGGDEDSAIALSITPALLDVDGSESLRVHISNLPTGATLSAGIPNADGSYTLTLDQLDGLMFTPPPHAAETFTLKVRAIATEGDSSAASAEQDLVVTVVPHADAPTLVVAAASGNPNSEIPLSISLVAVDPSEIVTISISGVPAGAALNHGSLGTDGIWSLTPADLAGLSVTPGSSGEDFTLTISVASADGPSSIATTQGTLAVTVADPVMGQAIDGYIVGATVFADANGNGVLDTGEASAITGANGAFSLAGGSGPLVLTGGTDMSTGLAFEGTLRAPEGSTVVTPLTTLIAALVDDGVSAADAEHQVEVAFGLSAGIELTTFDPVQAAQAGDPAALDVYAAGVQVQNTIAMASSLLDGAGATAQDATNAVLSSLASTIAAATERVNLGDAGTAQTIILDAATEAGVAGQAVDDTAAQAAAIIADVNLSVGAATAMPNPTEALRSIAQVALVAQDTEAGAAAALADAGATGDATQAHADFTGANLGTQITAAADEVGPVGGTQFGTPFADFFFGTTGADAYDGLGANDTINGADGNDFLFGNTGDDRLTGGNGIDLLDGGNTPGVPMELDVVDYSYAANGVNVNLATGIATVSATDHDTVLNFESVVGTAFDDTLTGGNAANDDFERFEGRAGNDTIDGGSGFDEAFYLGAGAITVDLSLASGQVINDGNGGTDTLVSIEAILGSNFADNITGSAGNDRFRGMGGADILNGGEGIDEADYRGSSSAVIVNLNPAFALTLSNGITTNPLTARDLGNGSIDTLISIEQARGGQFNDAFSGSAGDNRFRGEGGNDFFIGSAGNDLIEGGENAPGQNGDFDTVHYDLGSATAGVTVNLSLGTADDGFGGTDTLIDIEAVNGSKWDDVLIGGHPSNGTAIAHLEQFDGRAGNDFIDGGGGNDRATYEVAPNAVHIDLQQGKALSDGYGFQDTLANIERIRGSQHADQFYGSDTSYFNPYAIEWYEGRQGNDLIDGRGGIDLADFSFAFVGVAINLDSVAHATAYGVLAAGTAFDGFVAADGITRSVDTLVGIEQVRGSFMNDEMYGSNNPDTYLEIFEPQGGNDYVDGGGGVDVLRYATAGGSVTVDLLAGTAQDGNFGFDTFLNIEGAYGGNFADTLLGGNSAFETFDGRGGSDVIDGRGGHDRVDYIASPTAVNVNLATGTASDGWGGTDTLVSIEEIRGSLYADVLAGSAVAETFDGRGGNDAIDGGGGNDTVTYYQAGSGATVHLTSGRALDGEGGTDALVSIENVVGSDFNDYLFGMNADNVLEGGAGNDTLVGAGGSDTLRGGAGDDLLGGGLGLDSFDGGDGIDTMSIANANAGGDLNLLTGLAHGTETLANIENLTGSGFNDALRGDNNANVLIGLDGDDFMVGNGGDDQLFGGLGNDILIGGPGADLMDGGNTPGNPTEMDTVNYFGAPGVTVNFVTGTGGAPSGPMDTLLNIEAVIGTASADILTGGNAANDDFERFEGRGGNDLIDGGSGFDEASYFESPTGGASVDLSTGIATDGEGGTDTLSNIEAVRGSRFNDVMIGDSGSNRFRGESGNDSLNGGNGVDEADYRSTLFQVGAHVDLSAGTAFNDGFGNVDTLTSIENLRGSVNNDILIGNDVANRLLGDAGNDRLVGDAGDDTLSGGANNDVLVGGSGDDVLDGGENPSNQLTDLDTLDYSAEGGTSGVSVNLSEGTALDSFGNHDSISNIEVVIGTQQDDVLIGGGADNQGPLRSETFEGRGGADHIEGRIVNNWADYRNAALSGIVGDLAAGSVSNDGDGSSDTLVNMNRLRGSQFADQLFGSDTPTGDERFEGMGGDDFIDGRGGVDYLEYGVRPFGSSGVRVNLDNVEHDGVAALTAQDGLGGTDSFAGIEGVGGSHADDTIWGGAGDEVFEGRSGSDVIDGGGGFDRVEFLRSATGVSVDLSANIAFDGVGGIDTLFSIEAIRGSMFNDRLKGGTADDAIEGGRGNDTLIGHVGDDILDGGESPAGVFVDFDFVDYFLEGGFSGVTVNLAAGTATDTFANTDTLIDIEAVRGTQYADVLRGGNRTNDFSTEQFEGRGGNDLIDGGSGFDVAIYSAAGAGVHVDLAAGKAFDDGDFDFLLGQSGTDTLISVEWIRGSVFDDRLYGSDAAIERFEGHAGNDFIDGRGGFDYLVFQSSQSGVTADLQRGWVVDGFSGNVDVFLNMEGVRGSNFADSLYGTDNMGVTEAFEGVGGHDFFDGRGGRDRIEYQRSETAVNVNLESRLASDGFGTVDTFVNIEDAAGSLFNDILTGDAGNNVLEGRDGNDTLTGGVGEDTFVFRPSWLQPDALPDADTITDFATGAGGDRLDIRDLLIGFESSSPLSDYVSLASSGASTQVSVDRDGAGTAYGFGELATLSGVTTNLLGDLNLITT